MDWEDPACEGASALVYVSERELDWRLGMRPSVTRLGMPVAMKAPLQTEMPRSAVPVDGGGRRQRLAESSADWSDWR